MRRQVVDRLARSGGILTLGLVVMSCGRLGYDETELTPESIVHADAGADGSDAGAGGSAVDGGASSSTATTTGVGGSAGSVISGTSGGAGRIGDGAAGGGVGSGGAGGTGGAAGGRGGNAGSTGAAGASDGSASDSGTMEAGPPCPSGISFTGATQTPLRGGSTGAPTSNTCPAGQVVVGFVLSQDVSPPPTVGQITVFCGAISISQASCQVTIGAAMTLATRGGTANTPPVTQMCPMNQMVVAIQGGSGAYLDRVGAGCAPLNLVRVGSTYQASVGAITWFSPEGGGGGSAFSDSCPNNGIASGAYIQSGQWIDAMDLICSTPVLAP